MELNLKVEEKYNKYIASFDGLPGCWAYGDSMKDAIQAAYEFLQIWEKDAFHSGFACFQACLIGIF